ncbi:MAG: nitronate monooxygenase, partial [Sphingobacteriales bacterium]
MNWNNDITQRFHTVYPLIQAPMFGVTTVEMVVAATEAGCLGSLPLGDLPPEDCRALIRKVKAATDRPFAVNLFVNEVPQRTAALERSYAEAKLFLETLMARHGLQAQLPALDM